MPQRTGDWRSQRRREVRLATACGAMAGAMVGTLIGVPSSAFVWIAGTDGAAVLAFVGVWALWVSVGTLACWIGAVLGGMQLSVLMRWCVGLGMLAGVGTAVIPSSPFSVSAAVIIHGIGGVVLAFVVSHAWWRYFAGR